MSGSGGSDFGGGGGGIGGGGGGGGPPVDCSMLIIKTPLSSPNPDVLKKLHVGDTLLIEADSPRGPVKAKTEDEEIAGSITSGRLARLLQCIDDGYEYVAIIKQLDGGHCEVEVRPEAK